MSANSRMALDRRFQFTYKELLRLAELISKRSGTPEVDPSELLNQAYLELAEKGTKDVSREWDPAAESIIAETMQAITKRESENADESQSLIKELQESANLLFNDPTSGALYDALDALRNLFPETTPLVQAKLYDNLTDKQYAQMSGIPIDRVRREWEFTKLWLQREMGISARERKRNAGISKYQFLTGDADVVVVRIFYATDRKSYRTGTGVAYGYERTPDGALNFGECHVSIPRIHAKGKRELHKPGLFGRQPDPVKHVILVTSQERSQTEFFDRLAKSIVESDARDTFVFIHGYNVPFEDAARAVAQIAFDLEVKCAPILYSWPSNGAWFDYTRDENEVGWTGPHFEEFLLLVTQYSSAERIHIIAHSMGNRAVCSALESLSKDRGLPLKFNHLLLAAADVDRADFKQRACYLKRLSGRITLYQSSNDKALQASRVVHRHPRAGDPILIVNGVDTIDASEVETDLLGHSYFSQSRELLADMHAILFKDEPPSSRFGLTEMEHAEGTYYAFTP
jgi:esterase/lipase superfamily enzyme